MACAVVYTERFTAAGLQQFAARRLLRLPALPPLSPWLLGPWCRAVPDGRIGVLALVRPHQEPPPALLDAAHRAQGRVHAAVAVWR